MVFPFEKVDETRPRGRSREVSGRAPNFTLHKAKGLNRRRKLEGLRIYWEAPKLLSAEDQGANSSIFNPGIRLKSLTSEVTTAKPRERQVAPIMRS